MTHHVYQVLDISGRGARELAALLPDPEGKWLILNHSEDGLNIHYHLCLVIPRGKEYEIKLPREVQEICPACQGQGLTYNWRQARAAYEAEACLECQGQGFQSYDSEISLVVSDGGKGQQTYRNCDGEITLVVSDGLGGRQVIRKSKAGRLNARMGLRGDLVVNLTWVETLPGPEGRPAPGPAFGLN
ncbi:MAG: hypothetical protein LBC90_09265 [Candidatus Adiutrix sp.]|nr:hypothetical protein [Candidatus Adiutrix sp.]